GLPGYWAANTAYNGCGNTCDIYCPASAGYKEQFGRMGTDPSKIVVTGIPNYDNAAALLNNDFPHHGYVMVATSDIRETMEGGSSGFYPEVCVHCGLAAADLQIASQRGKRKGYCRDQAMGAVRPDLHGGEDGGDDRELRGTHHAIFHGSLYWDRAWKKSAFLFRCGAVEAAGSDPEW